MSLYLFDFAHRDKPQKCDEKGDVLGDYGIIAEGRQNNKTLIDDCSFDEKKNQFRFLSNIELGKIIIENNKICNKYKVYNHKIEIEKNYLEIYSVD